MDKHASGLSFRNLNFGTKIIILVIASFLVSYVVNFFFVKNVIEQQAMDGLIKKARARHPAGRKYEKLHRRDEDAV